MIGQAMDLARSSTTRDANRLRPRPLFGPERSGVPLRGCCRWKAPAGWGLRRPSARKVAARCAVAPTCDSGCRSWWADRIPPAHRASGSRSSGRAECRRSHGDHPPVASRPAHAGDEVQWRPMPHQRARTSALSSPCTSNIPIRWVNMETNSDNCRGSQPRVRATQMLCVGLHDK